ncbi:hypothetical protein AVEN_136223-1 [Araneus ventricosus]|uniref:Uncharacterized protein n=1 Tax=Araneus ventricosus TaxID=182803 RepID=A0A4Y2ITI8_ARAVE|nr:hypothetical protein AVEN_238522-1 [Araneus ventricosus]GBM80956.1 hypothetical protein AVEN_243379-1 [Araneus ventricosus]GBM80966.1 hypothetical protein AVEN_268227-1 [Araneus ventricosus]GBM80985.1 hypothetical protein AVEN_136223-1 [Araneus ventricosus]
MTWIPPVGTASTGMKSRRISKQVLASLVDYPPPVIVRTSFKRGRAVVGDNYKDPSLSIRAIAATVLQKPRMNMQPGITLLRIDGVDSDVFHAIPILCDLTPYRSFI